CPCACNSHPPTNWRDRVPGIDRRMPRCSATPAGATAGCGYDDVCGREGLDSSFSNSGMGSPQSSHRVVYALLMEGFDDDQTMSHSSRSTNLPDAILSLFRALPVVHEPPSGRLAVSAATSRLAR